MTFKEQLKVANDNNLSILDLEIANECDCVFSFEHTDKEFETLCNCVRRAYLKSDDMTIDSIVKLVDWLIVENGWSIQEIYDMPVYDLLVEANYRQ